MTPARFRRVQILFASFVLLTIVLVLAVPPVVRWLGDGWPAREVLRSDGGSMPIGFSPDGKTVLTYGRDGIKPWDVASGRAGKTWAFDQGKHPEAGAFSPDGKIYAAGVFAYGQPLSIDLFDVATGRVRASLSTNRRTIMHLAFSPDGQTIRAFLGDDPQSSPGSSWNHGYASDLLEVATWEVATGRPISTRPLATPTRGKGTAITLDGRIMAITETFKAVQLWDLDADKTLGVLNNPNQSFVTAPGLGFSDDGNVLAVGRWDGSVELWDVPGRRLTKTLKLSDPSFVFTRIRLSNDRRSIVATGYRVREKSPLGKMEDEARRQLGIKLRSEPEVIVVDVASGQRLGIAADSILPWFSPDGTTLATGEPDGSTRLRGVPRPKP